MVWMLLNCAFQILILTRLLHVFQYSFEISDTGIGIDEEAQRSIFDCFSQADDSTTRRYGGTGLGLALSKQLVECMQGQIGVISELGSGSTFWFHVHLQEGSQEEIKQLSWQNIHGLRILVADPNHTIRQVLSQHLSFWGGKYEAVANAPAVLDKLYQGIKEENPFALAILDKNLVEELPNLGEKIKTDPQLCSTRLIMLSGVAQRGEVKQAKAAGFQGYLTKPVRQKQLHDCICMVMGLQSQDKKTLIHRHTLAELEQLKQHRILVVEDNLFNQKVAFAVIAIIGNGDKASSCSRIFSVALKPSMMGIWQSISTRL